MPRAAQIGYRVLSLGIALTLFSSCTVPTAENIQNDTSAPGFLQLRIVYQRVTDGLEVGSEVIPETGFSRTGVPRDRRFVLSVSAADNESGISKVEIDGTMEWFCTPVQGELAEMKTAVLNPQSDEVRSGSATAGTPLIRNAHFTIDPFNGRPNRLVCGANENASELKVRIVVTVVNGKGLRTDSGPITITYLPRPAS